MKAHWRKARVKGDNGFSAELQGWFISCRRYIGHHSLWGPVIDGSFLSTILLFKSAMDNSSSNRHLRDKAPPFCIPPLASQLRLSEASFLKFYNIKIFLIMYILISDAFKLCL